MSCDVTTSRGQRIKRDRLGTRLRLVIIDCFARPIRADVVNARDQSCREFSKCSERLALFSAGKTPTLSPGSSLFFPLRGATEMVWEIVLLVNCMQVSCFWRHEITYFTHCCRCKQHLKKSSVYIVMTQKYFPSRSQRICCLIVSSTLRIFLVVWRVFHNTFPCYLSRWMVWLFM